MQHLDDSEMTVCCLQPQESVVKGKVRKGKPDSFHLVLMNLDLICLSAY